MNRGCNMRDPLPWSWGPCSSSSGVSGAAWQSGAGPGFPEELLLLSLKLPVDSASSTTPLTVLYLSLEELGNLES